MQPIGQDLPVARFAEGDMDLDVVLLPDPIKTPDPLFKQFRIQREVKQHQMTAELKIPAFAADFGSNQEPRAVFFGKPSGISVPLNQGQIFMKCAYFQVRPVSERRLDRGDLGLAAADKQNLLG